MSPIAPADVLVVFALRQEAGSHFDGLDSPVLYTGVGKINATWALTRALQTRQPALVLAFGTAGSPGLPPHTLVECTHFAQRDMDVRPLGVPLGTTPYDDLPALLEVPRRLPELPQACCGSADHFVAGHDVGDCDVVDMEAYALAKVCRRERVEFTAIRYVTDGGDSSAHRDWADNLPRAAAAFRALYDRLITGPAP